MEIVRFFVSSGKGLMRMSGPNRTPAYLQSHQLSQKLFPDDDSIVTKDTSITWAASGYQSLAITHCKTQAQLLKGEPIVSKISSWCQKHNRRHNGIKPNLAVVYFDTGDDADEFLYVKAVVAARAGIGYSAYKLTPDAPVEEVLAKIVELNGDDRVHGVLVQRPLPDHLWEHQVMGSVASQKHVEEFMRCRASNIAMDALTRLLVYHHRRWMFDLNIILLGGTNIITAQFKDELKHRHMNFDKSVQVLSKLEPAKLRPKHDTIIITELNQGCIITADMLGPAVKLVIDLGFDPDTKMGDLDPDVLEIDDLLVVPTPGGVLPVLLWIMMERTIRARDHIDSTQIWCGIPGCTAA
nr:bifunctional protein fold [Quercus suber]